MQILSGPEFTFIPVLNYMVEPRLRLVVEHAGGYLDEPT